LRLLIITKYFVPMHTEGKTRALQIEGLVSGLVRRGCECCVIAGIPEDVAPPKSVPGSVDVRRIPYVVSHRWLLRRRLSCFFFGSASLGWVRRAHREALAAVRSFRPSVVMSSSTPIDSHLTALRVLRRVALPWVCSLSDPWPSLVLPAPYHPVNPSLVVARGLRVNLRYARRVLARASAIHMFSRHGLALLEEKTGVPLTEKAHVIPHIGRDLLPRRKGEGESRERPSLKGNWLVHFGSLNHWRFSLPLFEAISDVAASHPDRFGGLICAGFVSDDFKDLIARRGWADYVRFAPWTDAPTLPDDLAEKAGCFLLVEADMPASPFVPSKLADYVCSGVPVLAITPETGATRDYLRDHPGAGIAVGHNRGQIAEALSRIFGISATARPFRPDSSLAENFSAEHIADQYIRMFEAVVGGASPAAQENTS